MATFLLLGLALVLAAAASVLVPLLRAGPGQSGWPALGVALLLPLGMFGLYLGVSNDPMLAGVSEPPPAQENMTSGGPSMADAVQRLRARLQEAPDDLEGWLLLGRSLFEMGDFAGAQDAYRRAVTLTEGKDTDALLGLAESQLLGDREQSLGEAGQLVEEVLTIEPDNPRALWYGGLVAQYRGDSELARERWQRLLSMNPPGQVREILERELAAMGAGPAPAPMDAADGGTLVEVTVQSGSALPADLPPAAVLFVFARVPGQAGPPLAVARTTAREFPVRVRLSDSDVMLPGTQLADMAELEITARVAMNGTPTANPGDIFGSALWQREGQAPLEIKLDRTVAP